VGAVVAEGGLLGAPYWTSGSAAICFQDQLDSEQGHLSHEDRESPGGESLQLRRNPSQQPLTCIFRGVGLDGSLYLMVERGLTDIYALDLDLP